MRKNILLLFCAFSLCSTSLVAQEQSKKNKSTSTEKRFINNSDKERYEEFLKKISLLKEKIADLSNKQKEVEDRNKEIKTLNIHMKLLVEKMDERVVAMDKFIEKNSTPNKKFDMMHDSLKNEIVMWQVLNEKRTNLLEEKKSK